MKENQKNKILINAKACDVMELYSTAKVLLDNDPRRDVRWALERQLIDILNITKISLDHLQEKDDLSYQYFIYDKLRITKEMIDNGKGQDGIRIEDRYLDTLCHYVHGVNYLDKYQEADKNKKQLSTQTVKKYTDEITYFIQLFQDTCIPLLNNSEYKKKFNAVLNLHLEWSKTLDQMYKSFYLGIHNFPTVIAYMKKRKKTEPLFFWPFFNFFGYAIFVKKTILKEYKDENNNSIDEFSQLTPDQTKQLLENNKLIVEKGTDMEWVLKNFCESHGCTWELMDVTDLPLNKGKKTFTSDSMYSVYCTNSLPVVDLMKNSDEYSLIGYGKSLTKHVNFNGLICTMEFFNENVDLIADLILFWFENINYWQKEWAKIIGAKKPNRIDTIETQMVLSLLNSDTDSNVELKDFLNSYSNNNYFYSTPMEAYQDFYEGALMKKIHVKNNWEIAKIQTEDVPDEIDKDLITSIIDSMKIVKDKLSLKFKKYE